MNNTSANMNHLDFDEALKYETVREEFDFNTRRRNSKELEGSFTYLKDKLSVVIKDCLNGADRFEEKKLLEARLNEAVKTLSSGELDKIIRGDVQFCLYRETANQLLWMCGLDAKSLPTGTTFEVEHSPDVRIGVGADDKGLRLYVETTEKGEIFSDYFGLNDAERVFNDALAAAEDAEREIAGKELEEGEEPGDR